MLKIAELKKESTSWGVGLIAFSSVPFQLLRSSLHAVSIMSLAASANGHYGRQVRVMTLTANLDGNYGWQVWVMTLAVSLMVSMAGKFEFVYMAMSK